MKKFDLTRTEKIAFIVLEPKGMVQSLIFCAKQEEWKYCNKPKETTLHCFKKQYQKSLTLSINSRKRN